MRLSGNNFIATIGFGLLSAIAVYFAFTPKLLQPLHILGHVAVAQATLDNQYMKTTRSTTGTSFNVAYSYTVAGKTYRGSSATSDQPQPTMPVQYVSDRPEINNMDLIGRAWFDLVIFAIPATVLLICGLALFLHLRHR